MYFWLTVLLEYLYGILWRVAVAIVKKGPVPRHISFIMDGNRRWARKHRLNNVIEGHKQGFSRLEEMIETCLMLGVHSLTVYAFSIDNFNRTQEEVEGLMELALQGFDLLPRNPVLGKKLKIKVHGDLSLVTEEIRTTIARTTEHTRSSHGVTLNICFSYTSRDEICRTIKEIGQSYINDELELKEVTPELFREKMVDIPDATVRTSGEWRLSDFLLWQNSMGSSYLFFIDQFWPDFSNFTLLYTIFSYQHSYPKIRRMKRHLWECSNRIWSD